MWPRCYHGDIAATLAFASCSEAAQRLSVVKISNEKRSLESSRPSSLLQYYVAQSCATQEMSAADNDHYASQFF
jgi:hypothetical protein